MDLHSKSALKWLLSEHITSVNNYKTPIKTFLILSFRYFFIFSFFLLYLIIVDIKKGIYKKKKEI